jgi:hypothetical protein
VSASVTSLEQRLREKARKDLGTDLEAAIIRLEQFNVPQAETALRDPGGNPYRVWQLLQALQGAIFDALAPVLESKSIAAFVAVVDEIQSLAGTPPAETEESRK